MLEGKHSISFSAKLQVFNSTVSTSESLQWETSKSDPSNHFHRTTSSHSRIPTCSLQLVNEKSVRASAQLCCPLVPVPLQQGLPRRQKEAGWCEDSRGVVAFPLPEAHARPACPAAHAPLAPHAPVAVHVLRDGRFTDTLPSSAPLQGNHVSTAGRKPWPGTGGL